MRRQLVFLFLLLYSISVLGQEQDTTSYCKNLLQEVMKYSKSLEDKVIQNNDVFYQKLEIDVTYHEDYQVPGNSTQTITEIYNDGENSHVIVQDIEYFSSDDSFYAIFHDSKVIVESKTDQKNGKGGYYSTHYMDSLFNHLTGDLCENLGEDIFKLTLQPDSVLSSFSLIEKVVLLINVEKLQVNEYQVFYHKPVQGVLAFKYKYLEQEIRKEHLGFSDIPNALLEKYNDYKLYTKE